ncbi:type II toxin-antitoxin system RelE/ParE family toxin [Aurantimonas sp. C2-6-R+9]|uniref:type II toxin-antitoxin system RelE/ParE family toxin n=1 Tax=unclassified Aurantimonas TaxID=2638230 RepID=UPI002E18EC2D|nr:MULTISPECIES: type II toxin-antitoxin system RelE/ParE family toxin [unclassified Aurantimonas]MEC5291217.1 type II toxin-antitoxin system RelE/ParE family toxin [Aurantimonas sp. C2-3-R2]MEC5380964.1 type II toxin-antitoxin system RelE/ParE family toxin [Aurantimonas sp. C2-6-R+9]MEC5412292.1 type II toxin-antitoxin system RelE/ParE family toxin [Aurantimonas sp. C2-4-R8]
MSEKAQHTVSELQTFRRHAITAGMSDDDIDRLVDFLSRNPEAGDEMQGTGGCRKLRFALEKSNKGKSGGVRTITLFTGPDLPVFLVTVFAKSKKVTLTKAERNALKKLSDKIVSQYSRRVMPLAVGEAG